MKRITACLSAVLLLMVLAGCGATARQIAAKSQGEKADVFQETTGDKPIPSGYADLVIKARIKTHLEGYHADESKDSAHGKDVYPFLINIDGQAVLWKVVGKKHELPKYVDGVTSRDPEAGTGMKYVLEKKVRLAAGTHKVFFGLSEEPYYTETELYVESGNAYVLEFNPRYWHEHLATRIPTFIKGINSYEVSIKGAKIN